MAVTKQEPLLQIITIQRKHLRQIIAPSYSPQTDSLFMRVSLALAEQKAKVIGWLWTQLATEEGNRALINENGNGEYYSSKKLWLVEFDGNPYLFPAPEGGTLAKLYPPESLKQIFV